MSIKLKTNYRKNRILYVDSYKISHFAQYPDNTECVFSYVEARGSIYKDIDTLIWADIRPLLIEFFDKPFTMAEVDQARDFCEKHGEPFNYEGWKYIVEKLCGVLPVKIRAVRGGSLVKLHNVLLTIESTDENVPWITSFVETVLLRAAWYATTIASISFQAKKIIYKNLLETTDDAENEIWFKLQDFGARGVSSQESASLGGMGHLINFKGTDTMSAIAYVMDYYFTEEMVGFSIPASEHSTMTILGPQGEFEQMQRMVDKFAKPGAMFAVVSDSYDIYRAVREYWCKGGLLQQVKEKGATVVIRPDSGDPTRVPVEIIQLLMELEGFTVNSKGYKVLPNYVRVIQGDGMNLTTIQQLYDNLKAAGISGSNVTVGMGGALLQKYDRDTFKWAMKASAAKLGGKWVDVFKDPITDPGKRSKRGRLTLALEDNGNNVEVVSKRVSELKNADEDILVTIYDNGVIEEAFEEFSEIRERAHSFLKREVHPELKKAA